MSARVSANSVFNDALTAIAPIVGLETVQSTGRVTELLIGNGSVITQYLADLFVQAQSEILFTTCFWASSASATLLHNALVALNERARRESRRVTVKIMFSSYSFRQKFLSFKGTRIWKPSTWRRLGLPPPEMLDALDLTVFSRFKKPFGVMHAKFLIIDRSLVILPSSNVSWENWYELAIRLEGDIIQKFLSYFFKYYYPSRSIIPPLLDERHLILTSSAFRNKYQSLLYSFQFPLLPLAFLSRGPSRWGALPFARITTPTLFQIEAITRARRKIFIQNPNLTSRAVIKALRQALRKQIEVTLYLPRNMMVLESLVTGWTTTAWCVRRLQKFSRKIAGNLIVEWFEGDERAPFVADKSHVKFMVVDEQCVMVGSSNCDRASACTSGEVNVAISDSDFAKSILSAIKRHQSTGRLDA